MKDYDEFKDDDILFPEDFDENEITIEECKEVKVSIDDLFPDNNKVQIEKKNMIDFNSPKLILEQEIEQPQSEYEKEMWDKIEEFEKDAWNPSMRGFKLKDEKMDKAINGLQPGVHVIAGCSNHGKSAILTDIEAGLLECNDNIYILSFSLDDSYQEKFARIAAILNKVTINFIKTPLLYNITKSENDDWYIKWKNSITKAKALTSKFNIYDGSFTCDVNEIRKKIEDTIETLKREAEFTGIQKRLVVTIDSFHDLMTSLDKLNKNSESKFEYIARELRSWVVNYNIPIICTAELKKMNAHRRPILDDIRDAIKIQFVAKNIMLVYNEVSQKSDGAQVYYNTPNDTAKKPVLEVSFAKNKYTEFKGRMYYLFRPESVTLVPATKENELKWSSKIFG